MSFLGRLARGAVNVVRGGISVATGGASERLITAAKQLGEYVHPAKKAAISIPQIQTPRVRAIIARTGVKQAPKKLKRPRIPPVYTEPSHPLTAKGKMKPKKSSGSKRTPPKGGLDLKGLSAEWKKAGKPGTWRDWIKSHAGK